jgi:ribosomal-protein-alanine N-acetyltransferase
MPSVNGYPRGNDLISLEFFTPTYDPIMSDARANYAIRGCRISDLHQVAEIEKVSFPDPYDKATFLRFLVWERKGFLVAEDQGTILGYVIASSGHGSGLIASIAVSPNYKQKGIGSTLMRAALDYLIGKVREVKLQVSVRNTAAIGLYIKFSFREAGRLQGYYPNGDDALLMTRQF